MSILDAMDERVKVLTVEALVQTLEEHSEANSDWCSSELGDFRYDGGFDPRKIVDRMYELLLAKLEAARAPEV